MKRLLRIVIVTLLSLMMVSAAFAAAPGKMNLKVGDEVYVCNCGSGCPCYSMAMKEGTCACGKDKLIKAKVTKVEKDAAYVQANGWDKPQAFPTQGKYLCACGPSCDCGAISQTPGKCVCGNDMKPVK
jgi:hypothetical protein